ncbi:MAG TPA: hypothetical protein VJX91_10135 [Candidatus Eisenbacteria bacterium]|nr:hypothetical protein [Candidatus Eisenbacteria bacterium]
MRRHDILVLAIRIGSLWFVFLAISAVSMAVMGWLLVGTPMTVALVVQASVLMGLYLVCWKYSSAFATKLLPEIIPEAPIVRWSKSDAQDVLLRVLGVYLLATAVAGVLNAWVGRDIPEVNGSIAHKLELKANLAKHGTLALFGIGLVLGRDGLTRMGNWIKNPMGADVQDEVEDASDEQEPDDVLR